MQQAPRPCRDAEIELHIKIKFRLGRSGPILRTARWRVLTGS